VIVEKGPSPDNIASDSRYGYGFVAVNGHPMERELLAIEDIIQGLQKILDMK
jgi:hypothetical protein